MSENGPVRSPRLIVSWNLPRLAADLAAHLEALERADELLNRPGQSEDFLEPYHLTPEDEHTVLGLAWKKYCLDCGRLWDQYMVYDGVWAQGGLGPWDWCCRECLSRRLGRPLEPGDFTPCLLNIEQGLAPCNDTPTFEDLHGGQSFSDWLDEQESARLISIMNDPARNPADRQRAITDLERHEGLRCAGASPEVEGRGVFDHPRRPSRASIFAPMHNIH